MFSMIQKRTISLRTVIFLTFMIVFFGTTGYLTYYSKNFYLENLPIVNTAMPERMEVNENGRYSYLISGESIHTDPFNNTYVLAARHISDLMGERFLAVKIEIWILEEQEDGRVLIDGIVQEEPILVGTGDTIKDGMSIRY